MLHNVSFLIFNMCQSWLVFWTTWADWKNMSGVRTTKHFESQRSNHKMLFYSVALLALLRYVASKGGRTRQLRVSKITWAEDVLIYVILLNFNMPLSADYSTWKIRAGNFERGEGRGKERKGSINHSSVFPLSKTLLVWGCRGEGVRWEWYHPPSRSR